MTRATLEKFFKKAVMCLFRQFNILNSNLYGTMSSAESTPNPRQDEVNAELVERSEGSHNTGVTPLLEAANIFQVRW